MVHVIKSAPFCYFLSISKSESDSVDEHIQSFKVLQSLCSCFMKQVTVVNLSAATDLEKQEGTYAGDGRGRRRRRRR